MQIELVRRAQHGDRDAFAALVTPQLDRLFGLAGLVLRDRARAEDALQEGLLRAWRDLPRLRDPERFDAWLRRLVVNAGRDEGRRARRRHGEISLEPMHEPAAKAAFGPVHDRDELAGAFRRLREGDRAVVSLRYYADLSNAEAAAALGIREVTFRSRLHRALRTMQAELAAEARRATHPEEQPS